MFEKGKKMVWRTEGKSDKKKKEKNPKLKKSKTPRKLVKSNRKEAGKNCQLTFTSKENPHQNLLLLVRSIMHFQYVLQWSEHALHKRKPKRISQIASKLCGNHFTQLTTRTKPHRSSECQHRCPCSPINFHPVPAPGDLKHRPYTCSCGFIYPIESLRLPRTNNSTMSHCPCKCHLQDFYLPKLVIKIISTLFPLWNFYLDKDQEKI